MSIYYELTKHTYRYAAICIISELYFRQFCRAFGLREIIVMLIILICYCARLRFICGAWETRTPHLNTASVAL